MKTEFIKCCPFCGHDEVEVCKTGPYWIRCAECGADSESHRLRRTAIAHWNRRYKEDDAATICNDMGRNG